MPPLKGLACVSLLTLVIAAPSAFAQSNGGTAPAPSAPTISPTGPSMAPGDQQSGQKTHKHRHRSRGTSPTGQSGTPATSGQ